MMEYDGSDGEVVPVQPDADMNIEDELRDLLASNHNNTHSSNLLINGSIGDKQSADSHILHLYDSYDQQLLRSFTDPAVRNGSKQLASDRHVVRTSVQHDRNQFINNTAHGIKNGSHTDLANDNVDELIGVDSVSLNDIQLHHSNIHAATRTQHAVMDADYKYKLSAIQKRCKQVLFNMNKRHYDISTQLNQRTTLLHAVSDTTRLAQNTVLSDIQNQLLAILQRQRNCVKDQYGDLKSSTALLPDGSQIRYRYRAHTPRLISIRIDAIRAVKNKLPGGLYVMCCTLYDRLGGSPMRWCRLPLNDKSTQRQPITHTCITDIPYRHGGKYWNLEMRFDQNSNALYICCPSVNNTRTSNVLIFELFRHSHGIDTVVAWCAFPLITSRYELISGKFKCPLIRGQCTPLIDRYQHIDELIKSNIDNWLANMYFRVTPITVRGDRIFNYTTLSYQWKLHYSLTTNAFITASNGHAYIQRQTTVNNKSINYQSTANTNTTTTNQALTNRRSALLADGLSLSSAINSAAGSIQRSSALLGQLQEHAAQKDIDESSKRLAAIERAKQLRQYHTIASAQHNSSKYTSTAMHRYRFLYSEVMSDLGYDRWGQFESWALILLFICCFWLRIYIHYTAEYYWIIQNNLPIISYTVLPYSVHIEYSCALVDTSRISAEILCIGSIGNIVVMLIFMLIPYIIQLCVGRRVIADAWFRLISCYGIMVIFDPILIILVDLMSVNLLNGDYFRLYHISGYVGLLFSAVIGLCCIILASAIYYLYIVHIHMNGRLLDLYSRLNSDSLYPNYLPCDTEISYNTLKHIIQRAKNFKGLFGTRRKILIASYVLVSDATPTNPIPTQQTTLHISIYNVTAPDPIKHKAEIRQIYRHFIRSHTGAIHEEFDVLLSGANMSDSIGSEYVEIERRWLDEYSSAEELQFLHNDNNHANVQIDDNDNTNPLSKQRIGRKLSGIHPLSKPSHQSTNRISTHHKYANKTLIRPQPNNHTLNAIRESEHVESEVSA